MCGRTACTLSPDDVCKACSLKAEDGSTYVKPEWLGNPTRTYVPSYNTPPSRMCPVMVAKNKFVDLDCSDNDLVVTPMYWGYIPKFHKGGPSDHGLSTSNCRVEGILTSPMYCPSLMHGQRCIVLAEGFFEWQRKGSHKQPFFCYMPETTNASWQNKEEWKWSETQGWQGPKLLHMAAVYHKWTSPKGEVIPNFAVMTMPSTGVMENIHDRMPVILDTEEKIKLWLSTKKLSAKALLDMVAQPVSLAMHPVTTSMGNVNVDSAICIKEFDVKKTGAFMKNWLAKGNTSTADQKQESKLSPIKGSMKRSCSDNEEEEEEELVTKKLKDEEAEEEIQNSLRIFLP